MLLKANCGIFSKVKPAVFHAVSTHATAPGEEDSVDFVADLFEEFVAAAHEVVFPCFLAVISAPRQKDALHSNAKEEQHHHIHPHRAFYSERCQELNHF